LTGGTLGKSRSPNFKNRLRRNSSGLQFGNGLALIKNFLFVARPNVTVRFVHADEERARNISVLNHCLRAGNERPEKVCFLMQFDRGKIVIARFFLSPADGFFSYFITFVFI